MADTTWLQCTMPRDEWEKLNKRREKLGIKWAKLIPGAVEIALAHLETHPADLAELVGPPKAPAPTPTEIKAAKKKADKEKADKANKAKADKAKKKADAAAAGEAGETTLAATEPDTPVTTLPTAEDLEELGSIQ